MSRFMQTAALVGAFAATAYAHGRVSSITADGKEYPGFDNSYLYGATLPADLVAWSANNGDNGFVDPTKYASSADIACHLGGKTGGGVATVAAGSKIGLQWNTWPESHHGPVIDYLAKCAGDDCTSVTAADLSFFKVAEAGLNSGDPAPGSWASDDLIAAGNKWEVTIPETLAPGQYVLRHEIIALHSAGDANGAQNYPQCFNIEVTGSGSASPEGVAANKLYTPEDAGISVNIYYPVLTSYDIPGPAVWDGASSGGSGPAPSGSPSEAGPTATSAPASGPTSYASTPASTPAATPSSAVPPYGGSNSTIPGATGTGTGYPTATGAPVPSATSSAPASPTTTETPPPYATDVPVDPVDEAPSSSAPAPSATSAAPSTPTEAPSYGGDDDESEDGEGAGYGTSKPLPEGVTLKDLLGWLNYYVKKGYESEGASRVHARQFVRRA